VSSCGGDVRTFAVPPPRVSRLDEQGDSDYEQDLMDALERDKVVASDDELAKAAPEASSSELSSDSSSSDDDTSDSSDDEDDDGESSAFSDSFDYF
jgi:hypothetical protein